MILLRQRPVPGGVHAGGCALAVGVGRGNLAKVAAQKTFAERIVSDNLMLVCVAEGTLILLK